MKYYKCFIICISLILSNSNTYKDIQEKFILAEQGDTIYLPVGKISVDRSLWADNLDNADPPIL